MLRFPSRIAGIYRKHTSRESANTINVYGAFTRVSMKLLVCEVRTPYDVRLMGNDTTAAGIRETNKVNVHGFSCRENESVEGRVGGEHTHEWSMKYKIIGFQFMAWNICSFTSILFNPSSAVETKIIIWRPCISLLWNTSKRVYLAHLRHCFHILTSCRYMIHYSPFQLKKSFRNQRILLKVLVNHTKILKVIFGM